MSHFKIMGGDLPKTTALITVFGALQLSAPRPGFTLRTDTYDLKNNIALIEQITEDNKNKVLSKAGWSTLGAIALGPVGLLAGLLMGGRTKYICMAVKLKSGEEFIAECDTKTYQKFHSAFLESRTSRDNEVDEEKELAAKNNTTSDPTALLKQLKELKDSGVITEEEYKKKARKVLCDI